MSTAARDTDRAATLRTLVAGAVDNLVATWSDKHGRFPYRSRIEAGSIENDYSHPLAVRYTLNSLLGLVQAARSGDGPDLDQVLSWYGTFRARPENETTSLADAGMHTLVALALETDERERLVGELKRVTGVHGPVLQDVAWALWAACAAEREGVAGAAESVSALWSRLVGRHTSPIGLPYHSPSRYRRRLVSFGALTYFLRAVHEASGLVDDRADRLFVDGVRRATTLQRPLGGWPWLIDAHTGSTLDAFPLFAVHQDSMAMLFLLPALDRGVEGVEAVIDLSLSWAFGDNELQTRMYLDEPVLFPFRSIERRERASRARRYGRALVAAVTSRPHPEPAPSRLRLNDECRSYHPGWILYAWCGHPLLGATPRHAAGGAA